MGFMDVIRTLTEIPTLLTLKRGLRPRPPDTRDSIGAMLERTAAAHPDNTAIIFEGRTITWRDFNGLANQYARVFQLHGFGRGDSVSVMLENRIELLATIVALNKLGVTAALLNTNVRGRSLTHCIEITTSSKLVFGAELLDAVAEVKGDLTLREGTDYFCVADAAAPATSDNWAHDLGALAEQAATDNLPETREAKLKDNALYIFTSGTTGLPKAAVMSNRRYLAGATLSHAAGLKCTPNDRLYICLPLYHATGVLVGVGAAMSSGASMFIRRRFSASRFLDEVREHQTNCFVYIGELCRYLVNTPRRDDDHDNPLTRMTGNGLRPDVWPEFKQRFGIKRVSEFYASSEGNIAFANVLNKDCTVGMTSSRHALVRYDVDADEIVRDEQGRCLEVARGETGLLLGHINPQAVFEGYTSPEATEKKIVRDVLEAGDQWFNTGDLLREVDAGFTLGYPHYQFVDRVGDTFRWRGENVSTNEVGEIINGHPQVRFCNVYGVQIPGADGRAGMAALTLAEGVEQLDLDDFSAHVNRELPPYARPVFLRVEQEMDVTGTYKLVKVKLREEGYDPARTDDPLYVLKSGNDRYQPLDADLAAAIARGEGGY